MNLPLSRLQSRVRFLLQFVSRELELLSVLFAIGMFVRLNALVTKSKNRIIWCKPNPSKPTRREALAVQMEQIVAHCAELQQSTYIPTWFVPGAWANVILFVVKAKLVQLGHQIFGYPRLIRENLRALDGAVLSIDYIEDKHTKSLPDDAPIVMVLHTISGSGPESIWFLREASRRGWRSCCFNRRGHVGRLVIPRFNLLGSMADTALQRKAVAKKWPQAKFFAMVGISAGSGLVVSYLGSSGHSSGIDAACSLCPAYDISKAFNYLHQQSPLVDRLILKGLKNRFIAPNRELLAHTNSAALSNCEEATTLYQFLLAHAPFAGTTTVQEYMQRFNPMNHLEGISCPVLILNSEDDMVCRSENIREDLVSNMGGAVLVRSTHGSHCAYSEHWTGTGSYLCRVTFDFLDAALETGAKSIELDSKSEI